MVSAKKFASRWGKKHTNGGGGDSDGGADTDREIVEVEELDEELDNG